jgi:hypothetical protein
MRLQPITSLVLIIALPPHTFAAATRVEATSQGTPRARLPLVPRGWGLA